MELNEIVSKMVKGIKPIDDKINHGRSPRTGKWGEYLGGIGSGYEIDFRDELVQWWNDTYSGSIMESEVKYPEGGGRCDICISEAPDGLKNTDLRDWAIELKFVRNIGDNGGINNFGLGKVVSPYKSERSSVHDCKKLPGSKISRRKGVVIFGFEFDSESVRKCREWEDKNRDLIPDHQLPPNFPLRSERMETVLSKNTYQGEWLWDDIVPIFKSACESMDISLKEVVKDRCDDLTRHPVYHKIKFLGWEILD